MSNESVANKAGGKKRGQAGASPADRQSRESGWSDLERLAVQVADGIGEARAELRDAFEALTEASSEGCAESHSGHADLALALVRVESMLGAVERTARTALADAGWKPQRRGPELAAGEEHGHG